MGRLVAPFEAHTMPNGAVVYYRDSDHTYHSDIRDDGKKWVGKGRWGDLPSPSQIAKFADPSPDKLMGYAARKTLDGVFALGSIDFAADAEDIANALKEKKYTWRDMRDNKGDLGTETHKAFELLLDGLLPEQLPEPSDPALGYFKGLIEFFNDLGDWETLQSEAVVYSQHHSYAGRFDARMAVFPWDETWMIDLKTSNYIGRAAHNQLVGYDIAAEECGYGKSDKLFILQVFPEPQHDGKHYHLWPCRGTRDGFLGNLLSYRDGKRLDADMKRDYKEWRA